MTIEPTKSRKTPDANAKEHVQLPFAALFQNDLLWSPYRAAAKLYLQSGRNAAAMLKINRKLADEFRQIVRREQDAFDDISVQMLERMSNGGGISAGPEFSNSLTDFYEAAVDGVREFGEALSEAQASSFEVFRESAGATAETISQAVAERKAAEQKAA